MSRSTRSAPSARCLATRLERRNEQQLQRRGQSRAAGVALTASGKDKGRLTRADFVRVERIAADRRAMASPNRRPKRCCTSSRRSSRASARCCTRIRSGARCCPTISIPQGGFELSGYEMLKGLEGIATHETTAWVEIFDNTQDIPSLAVAGARSE